MHTIYVLMSFIQPAIKEHLCLMSGTTDMSFHDIPSGRYEDMQLVAKTDQIKTTYIYSYNTANEITAVFCCHSDAPAVKNGGH